jgi:hypothetical protein
VLLQLWCYGAALSLDAAVVMPSLVPCLIVPFTCAKATHFVCAQHRRQNTCAHISMQWSCGMVHPHAWAVPAPPSLPLFGEPKRRVSQQHPRGEWEVFVIDRWLWLSVCAQSAPCVAWLGQAQTASCTARTVVNGALSCAVSFFSCLPFTRLYYAKTLRCR